MLAHSKNRCVSLITKRCLFVPSNSLTDSRKKKAISAKPRVKYNPRGSNDRTSKTIHRNDQLQSQQQKQHHHHKRQQQQQQQPPINKSIVERVRNDLRELRSLKKDIAEYIDPKDTDSLTDIQKIPTEMPLVDIDQATEDIFQEISDSQKAENKPKALPPSLAFPDAINDRLGLVADLLGLGTSNNVPEKTQPNIWKLILAQLNESGGFKGLSEKDIKLFVNKIPSKTLPHLIPTIEKMYSEAGVSIHYNTYYSFIRALTLGGKISNSQVEVIERYLKEIEKQIELKIDHYETMIAVYVKNNNKKKIEDVLAIIRDSKLPFLKSIFNSVLSNYVYYAKDHKRAIEVFDAMKFLSEQTKPDTEAYAKIVVSCMLNKDVEKALDLLEEMKDNNIQPNQKLLSALAKGCLKSKQHKYKAWGFLFQIYDHGWTPTLQTFEHMLSMAAKDGDVELTRCLFYKMLETNAVTPGSFNSLMVAYSKYESPETRKQPFLISLSEKGRLFKQNIIANVDFSTPVHGFPFLPASRIPDYKFVLAESSAIWAYTIMRNPKFINDPRMAAPYITIASEFGEFKEFKDRFNESTYLNTDGIPKVREIEIIEPTEHEQEQQLGNDENKHDLELQEESKTTDLVKSPILSDIQSQIQDNRFKSPRDSFIYDIVIKGAGKFKNFEFVQEIIKERGEFRKSNLFKQMSSKQQNELDFQFAESLVQCFIDMNLLEDAYSVVLLSVERFPWSWKQLGALNIAALNLGSMELAEAVKKIALKNQEKYHGKINRTDFKKFVMKRGY